MKQKTNITSLPKVEISKEKQENLIEFFENLEDNEDVQNFFNNANLINN